MNNLTLIIPSKKESESLPIFLKELENINCIKLIVLENEDINTENSIKKIENIKILKQKNPGYGRAIIEGINNTETDYCCIINADGSMDPKYLSEMLKLCTDGNDLIFGSRYLRPGGGSEDDTFITLIGNKFFSLLGNILYKLKISDILYTYILGKTSSFKSLELKNYDFRLCVEIPIKAKKFHLKYKDIASFERSRIAGKKKVNAFKDGFLILIEMLNLFFWYKKK